tara:strand:- start:5834 stop:6340 length:507 start_codon:yes stop_codon:yes gene_type:complete
MIDENINNRSGQTYGGTSRPAEKNANESVGQAKERIYRQKTEDMIINNMLEDHNIIVDPVAVKYSKYAESDQFVQDQYNLMAFEIFSQDYQDALQRFPRGAQAFTFDKFVETANNERDYQELLVSREGAPKNSPAEIFDSIFGGDMGIMKLAALKGYQLKLESSGTTE